MNELVVSCFFDNEEHGDHHSFQQRPHLFTSVQRALTSSAFTQPENQRPFLLQFVHLIRFWVAPSFILLASEKGRHAGRLLLAGLSPVRVNLLPQ